MTDDNAAQQAKTVFLAAIKIDDAQARQEYVQQACGSNSALLQQVIELLQAHQATLAEGDLGLLDAAVDRFRPHQTPTELLADPSPLTGGIEVTDHPMIGPYQIREKIGEGGMGVVYAAEQLKPLRRMVALKVIKPGLDSKQIIARFEAERQTLAMMDHPNIAKIFDAGMLDSVGDTDRHHLPAAAAAGRPYFVMELVHGAPITIFCDQQKLTTQQRLQLFVTVCRAVQHAHMKGIIHRDLKPSNVIVGMSDEGPVPKVIDFGVAKALHQRLTDETVYTHYAQLIGTPLYMSPEQAQSPGTDIDTRSDVYSLGIMLYELLSGTLPFQKEELEKKGLEEMIRVIREVDPPKPSVRLSTLSSAKASTISGRRNTDPLNLSLTMKRELDWIVLKSLEKDRSRRYQSANALAEDIERYLHNEPVLACPPSLAYRLRKAISKHKALCTTVALVLFTALAGTVVSLRYARQAELALTESRIAQLVLEQRAAELKQANNRFQQLLYAADLKLAWDAVANSDIPRVVELLSRHVPTEPSQADYRSFEWHLLRKRVTLPRSVVLELSDWVGDVRVSPDGKWLAASGDQGTVSIFDTTNWSRWKRISSGSESVNGLAWSPQGTTLAIACQNGKICLATFPFDTEPEECFEAHRGEAKDVLFAPDGQTLYTAGDDHTARHWSLKDRKLIREIAHHDRQIEQIALSADGRWLATASSDQTSAIWDAESGELKRRFSFLHGRMVCVEFSPDAKLLATGSILGDLYLLDVATGKQRLHHEMLDGVESVVFYDSGQWLASADRGGAVQLHPLPDTEASRLAATTGNPRWLAHQGRAISLTVTPDSQTLISGGRDGTARVWAPEPGAFRWQLPHASGDPDATFGADGQLFVAGNSIHVWSLSQRRELTAFGQADAPWELLECSADGRVLATARRGQIAAWDTSSHQLINQWTIDPRLDPHRLAISSDGQLIALTDFTDRELVTLYHVDEARPLRSLPAVQCNTLAFSPAARLLAVGNLDDLLLYDLSRGGDQPPRLLKGHSDTLSGAAFSPDGQRLATISHDRHLKVWRTATSQIEHSIFAHRGQVRWVTFTADGRTIITSSENAHVRFWQTASGQPLGSLPIGPDPKKHIIDSSGLHLGVVPSDSDSPLIIYDASELN